MIGIGEAGNRSAVGNAILDLANLKGRVHRYEHEPAMQAGKHQHEVIGKILHGQDDAVARALRFGQALPKASSPAATAPNSRAAVPGRAPEPELTA